MMTIQEAIERIKYRIYTATKIVGKGQDGEGFEDLEMMIDKLAEYGDLEEQGLPLRLPCKVGDTVYYILGIPQNTLCCRGD